MYLEVSDVKKSYGEGGSYIQVLKGVSLQVKSRGRYVCHSREPVVPVSLRY